MSSSLQLTLRQLRDFTFSWKKKSCGLSHSIPTNLRMGAGSHLQDPRHI